MNKPVIGVDLDDVCWDLLTSWLKRYNDISGDDLKPDDIKSWDIADYIHKGSPGMLFYILEQYDFWDTVNPHLESQHYLKKIQQKGYEIYIVTATSYKILHTKMLRFFKLFPFIKPEQIITAKNKKLINVDVLIDDNPENLKGGRYTKVLFDAPHNRSYNEKKIGAYRCKNWKETYNIIMTMYPIEARD